MRRRWLLLVALIAFAGGLWLRAATLTEEGDGQVAVAPPTPAVVPAAVAVNESMKVVSPPTPTSVPIKPTLGQFQEGFCAPEGDEIARPERMLLRRLRDEADARRQRAAGFDADETALIMTTLTSASLSNEQKLDRAQAFARQHPSSLWSQVIIALVAKAVGQGEVERTALRRVRELSPHDAAAGLAVALATRHSPDLDEAIDGLTDFLAAEPTPALARLKARLEVQRDLQRTYTRRTRRGVTMLWPAEALTSTQADDVLIAIDQALDDAAKRTGSSRRETLTVVVYPGRSELLAVSCVPTWAGGLFDGVLRLVVSEDALGVRRKTLLHETLHAQLTPFAPQAPKWFHEGVAEAFADERDDARGPWALMVKNKVWVPFESLDGSFTVLNGPDAQLAYAQSLGMVDFLEATCGPSALAEAIAAFQTGASTAKALARACHRDEVTGAELLDYLARL